jgi:DNA mismatch repair protein MutS
MCADGHALFGGARMASKGPGMLDQYREIKEQYPDTILFFRMGDFYEMFYEDAVIGAEVLGITLTSRDKNAEDPVPMAGIPWHSVEDYLRKMVQSGHKVTVCEQASEPLPGEKILRRVVSRVYTPGSLYEDSLIGEDGSALLASVVLKSDSLGLALLDTSTGRAWAQQFEGHSRFDRLRDEMLRWSPAELVTSSRDAGNESLRSVIFDVDGLSISTHECSSKRRMEVVRHHLEIADLGSIDLDSRPIGMEACGLSASYISSLHLIDTVPLREISIEDDSDYMALDQTTLKNLELTQTLLGERTGSLLHAIDQTRTWMGRRMLKEWLLRPLMNKTRIAERHSAVSSLVKASKRLASIRSTLQSMRDLERLSTRLAYDRANARDLIAISDALSRMPRLQGLINESSDELLISLGEGLTSLEPIRLMIEEELLDEPLQTIRDGGLFREGVDSTLDELRIRSGEGKEWLNGFEQKERERLNIPSLKVRFNRQFGYFIEVTKVHSDKVPEEYRRRQTLTNAERYTTDELAEWEDIILNAGGRANDLEYRLFLDLRERVKIASSSLSMIARNVAAIDVLCSIAEQSRRRSWVRPEIFDDERLEIIAGRHPVLEEVEGFVPNDVNFGKNKKFLLLTGPNMGGKSTYLRQTALISILAQAGSFVPAKKARIGLIDRVFTRVGAHDDLRRGRSTFMVEMIEVAHILRSATSRSLVLLDEVGRGTSTFDGLAIAWSVTEDLASRIGSRSLFATHYHQLTGLENEIDTLSNIHVQVAEIDRELTFLHTISDGPCDDSYGVQVASLAGLPASVIERARDLLIFLEQQAEGAKAGGKGIPLSRPDGQSSLFGWMIPSDSNLDVAHSSPPLNHPILTERQRDLLDRLSSLDPDRMTPREALDALYALKAEEEGKEKLPDWLEE